MTRKRFVIIGISDCGQPFFPPEVAAIITAGKVFSGGERHHEIVRGLLPAGYRWIGIRVPLREVFRQYEACFAANAEDIIVFASGDPFFYGFASTIRRECPAVPLTVFPAFNSLQMLAHRMQLPYERMRAVSVTGRPWTRRSSWASPSSDVSPTGTRRRRPSGSACRTTDSATIR